METNFETVSPFINVNIEKIALDKLMNNISLHYSALSEIKAKFNSEFSKYRCIPDLSEMYLNPVFNEMKLLQLLDGNYFRTFNDKYRKKYGLNIDKVDNKFLQDLFDVVIQFVYRYYSSEVLKSYVKLLSGQKIENSILKSCLCGYQDGVNGYTNAKMSEFRKRQDDLFIWDRTDDSIVINDNILKRVKDLGAYCLFKEYINLFQLVAEEENYVLSPFDLVTRTEFLINTGAKNIYQMTGEELNHENKKMYCPVSNESSKSKFPNMIVDSNHFKYYTKEEISIEAHNKKIEKIIKENYEIKLAVQFPQAKYKGTSFFYMGRTKIVDVGDACLNSTGKYNTYIILELESEIPSQLMQYKRITDIEKN